MFKMKKKKGFTLVELLAVIVILAVVILIAVTAVIPRMNKAKKNAFIDDALIYLKAAEEAYAFDDENIGSSCINITDLNNNYVKKSGDNYIGTITTELTNGDYVQTISLTNGKYYLVSSSTNMSADDVKSSMPQGFKSSCGNNNSMVAQCLNDDSSCSLPASLDGYSSVNVTRTGKNLYGGNKLATDMDTVFESGYSRTGNIAEFGLYATVNESFGYLPYSENTSYTIIMSVAKSNTNKSTNLRVYYTDGTNTNIQIPETTITANTKYTFAFVTSDSKTLKSIRKYTGSGTTTLYIDEFGVFKGTLSASQFEPYTGITEIIPLGQTIYGGSLDVTSGVLTITHGSKLFSDLSWTKHSTYSNTYYADVPDIKAGSTSHLVNAICSAYNAVTRQEQTQQAPNYTFSATSQNNRVFVIDDSYQDLTAFETGTANYQIVYELATPVTVQLTNISTSN